MCDNKLECRTKLSREGSGKANLAETENEVSLLMVCHAKEDTHKNLWYLDTGCSNHMFGDKYAFSDFDESFRDSVKFGDNSKVSRRGKRKGNNSNKRKFDSNYIHIISNVLFILDLRITLLSIGQLQEK
ncbi:Retrovirus-related Pol polyprotein from transposon TNT 1-94 [Quillaja saponaria]|uniref:Retrovirus-related Pol polyprotein from transposon TNT 1-94 n=1 Tax=Quillaja saponaria TaxID=32244 RepID=A0AAD7LJZ0_QUISA|nr:Retrovirus-related Pol polyprotein from transposon TNT 1-94 [Quillaja saponaria]